MTIAGALVPGLLAAVHVVAEPAAGGRLRLGGEVSGTLAPRAVAAFQDNGYGDSLLRLFRVRLGAELLVVSRLSMVGEVRSDNVDSPRVYAFYVRIRPWPQHTFDVQAGLIPPVFGAYPRRHYAAVEPLPGAPLVYQYPTSLRAHEIPYSVDSLVARRTTEDPNAYRTASDYASATGLPIVNVERWDAGVQARVGVRSLQLALALTQGALSRPSVSDRNPGKQIAARLEWRPAPALSVGASFARGAYLDRDAVPQASPASAFHQRALGLDLESAYGHWMARGEVIWSAWDLPIVTEPAPGSVSALGGFIEIRYKIAAGWSVAARGGHLSFGEMPARSGALPWDAPVSRVEAGVAFSPRRRVVLKAAYEADWRERGSARRAHGGVAQVVVWF